MHTPTPYHVGVDTDLVVNEKCLIVADCGRGFRDDNCDNAAFIVRACNSHDALVEALKGLVDILSEQGWDGQSATDAHDKAIALLDKYKGEA